MLPVFPMGCVQSVYLEIMGLSFEAMDHQINQTILKMKWKNSKGVLCVCVRSGCKQKIHACVLDSTDPA